MPVSKKTTTKKTGTKKTSTKKTTAASKLTVETLIACFTEMDKVMGLQPDPDSPLADKKIDELTTDELKKQIILDAVSIDPKDVFSEEALSTLKVLGAKLPDFVKEEPKVDKKTAAANKKAADKKAAADKKVTADKKAATTKKTAAKADPFENPSRTTAILMVVVENPTLTNEEVQEKAEALCGKEISKSTVSIQKSDTLKTLLFLKKKKMLK